MTRKIFVLRHGETQFNAEQKLQGHCNSPLTAKGAAQAQGVAAQLKTHLAEQNFTVYSSPLGRAVQTAHIICETLSYCPTRVVEDPRLKEFSLGTWEQRTIPSLTLEHPTLLENNDWYLNAPQSETYDAVQARLTHWLSEIPESDNVVVVSHGLTGIALRGLLLGLSYEQAWTQDLPQDAFFIIENQSVTRVNCEVKTT
ncbi:MULTISPECIES: histidine phosphatase family protein [unclassified Motilimonas]|uniref:histidine phosphatase family protein n=1 Tax=Motilimonas TaxID=1914248 RepID=UPI001E3A3D89|nr:MULTISPECIES: histidine phosphatase family protein [unclassified Motilimonas]MCE0556861.1 histidine phosphatase family protein [Motilimonas sp. E26]MDO6525077.1 histidine phosphatase family protein [Motilimonas sp. 1_MG-2023]